MYFEPCEQKKVFEFKLKLALKVEQFDLGLKFEYSEFEIVQL